MTPQCQIVVIGAGHAGCEAALASARLGTPTLLITMDPSAVARMSCNPSVGGIAKSHIVFELDALGAEIARNADFTGIQFRTLNTRKGPAVQAHRAQCDKAAYSARMSAVVNQTANLTIVKGLVDEILVKSDTVHGVRLSDGSIIQADAVIVTPGTFLRGRIFVGKKSYPGGRTGEAVADQLSECLKRLGFRMGRLKTGTPPRIHGDSVDFDKMQIQPGLEPPPFFSHDARQEWELRGLDDKGKNEMFHVEHSNDPLHPWPVGIRQVPCYLTHTTKHTHDIIRANLAQSALYGGLITGTGVRYCPSIEDKVVKFADKDAHHVFIEPEGRNSPVIGDVLFFL